MVFWHRDSPVARCSLPRGMKAVRLGLLYEPHFVGDGRMSALLAP